MQKQKRILPFFSIFFFVFTFQVLFTPVFPVLAQDLICKEKIELPFSEAIKEDPTTTLDPKLMHFHSENLKPFHYETELAKHNQLDPSEVVGLTRNFHDSIVATGELGFYRKRGHDIDLHVSHHKDQLVILKDFNLINAYKWGMGNLKLGEITAEDIVELRKKTIMWFYKKDGEKREVKDFRFKSDGDSVFLGDKLDQKVVERLKGYGHTVSLYKTVDEMPEDLRKKIEKFKIKMQPNAPGIYVINYPKEEILKEDLKKFTTDLNNLIKARAPPEYIAAFAVQDILLLHPFQDGNGRTSRLLGQILYKKLTGKTIVFPEEFHKEMNFSTEELGQKLLLPKGEETTFHPEIFQNHKFHLLGNIDEAIHYSFFGSGKLPEILTPKLVQKVDMMGKVDKVDQVNTLDELKMEDLTVPYKTVSEDVKTLPKTENIFFGKGFQDEKSAISFIKTLFAQGRQRKDGTHVDVRAHQKSTKDYPSSFLQTTRNFAKATDFTYNRNFPVVFFFDHQGLDIVKVNEFYAYIQAQGIGTYDNLFPQEEEVLIYKEIPAGKILGAILFDKDLVPKNIFVNGNREDSLGK